MGLHVRHLARSWCPYTQLAGYYFFLSHRIIVVSCKSDAHRSINNAYRTTTAATTTEAACICHENEGDGQWSETKVQWPLECVRRWYSRTICEVLGMAFFLYTYTLAPLIQLAKWLWECQCNTNTHDQALSKVIYEYIFYILQLCCTKTQTSTTKIYSLLSNEMLYDNSNFDPPKQ